VGDDEDQGQEEEHEHQRRPDPERGEAHPFGNAGVQHGGAGDEDARHQHRHRCLERTSQSERSDGEQHHRGNDRAEPAVDPVEPADHPTSQKSETERPQDSDHEDHRHGGAERGVLRLGELRGDEVAGHVALGAAEQVGRDVVARQRHEHEDDAGDDARLGER
jgi:hypothetical protein